MEHNKFKIIAGPCLAESEKMVKDTAEHLKKITSNYSDIDFYFKASYRKANRTSYKSFSGVGDIVALKWLDDIRNDLKIKCLTDVHTPDEVTIAANYVDVIQIPAFLARQTDIIVTAAQTGLSVNIKKGQFMAPDEMQKAAEKAIEGCKANVQNLETKPDIWLTERGTFFGYHDLVVDFRSLLRMREFGFPIIYDATHSLQLPAVSDISGGLPTYIIPLAKAALAVGIDGIFFETHPDSINALSDAATQLPLADAENFIEIIIKSIKYKV